MPNVILPFGVPVRVAGCFEAQLQHFENSGHMVRYNKTGVITPRFGNISEWFKFYNKHVQVRTDIVYFLNTSSAENAVLSIEGVDKPNDCGFHVDQQLPDGTFPALPAIDFPTNTPLIKAPIIVAIPSGTVGYDAAEQTFSPLAGATDPEGGVLSIASVSVSPATAGTATIVGNDVKFVPNPDYTGIATVTYVIQSTSGARTTGSVKYTITANKSPIITAIPDKSILSSAGVQVVDVLAATTDPEGKAMTIEPALTVSPVAGGTVAINAGKIEFTPSAGYQGAVTVGFDIKDDQGKVAHGSFTYNVTKDLAPAASTVAITLIKRETLYPTVITAGQDPEGQTVTITDIDLNGFDGTVIVDPSDPKKLKIKANAGAAFGAHVIKFMAYDGTNKTPSTLTITLKKDDIVLGHPKHLYLQNSDLSSGVITTASLVDENLDNQVLTMVLTGLPPEFTSVTDSVTHSITVTSSLTASDKLTGNSIRTVLTDENGKTYSENLRIHVNHAPTVKVVQPTTTLIATDDSKLTDVVANLEDLDGNAVVIANIISVVPNTVTATIEAGKIKVTRTSNAATASTITFKVKDNKGGFLTSTLDVVVEESKVMNLQVHGTATAGDKVKFLAKCSFSISHNDDGVYTEYPENAAEASIEFTTTTGNFDIKGYGVSRFQFKNTLSLKTINVNLMQGVANISGFLAGARNLTALTVDSNDVFKDATTTEEMFYYCDSLPSLPPLEFPATAVTSNMYYGCSSLSSVPTVYGTLTAAHGMFRSCGHLPSVPLIDTAACTDLTSVFQGCTSVTVLPLIDTSNATDLSYIYAGCTSVTTFLLTNTTACTNFTGMYSGNYGATSLPVLDTSNGTSFRNMYHSVGYSHHVDFPLINTSNGTNFFGMYNGCKKNTSFPLIDTANGTTFASMYMNATVCTVFPAIDTSKAYSTAKMYFKAGACEYFPVLNTNKVVNASFMYGNTGIICLKSIDLTSCANSSGIFTNTPKRIAPTNADVVDGTSWVNPSPCPEAIFDVSGTTVASGDTVEVTAKCSLSISANNDGNYVEYADNAGGHTVSFTSTGSFHIKGKNVTAFKFSDGSKLKTVHLERADDLTSTREFLLNAVQLTNFTVSNPDVTKNVTTTEYMFSSCRKLTSFPMLNTSSATNTADMFSFCTSATSFPLIDTSSATDVHSMFSVCTSATSFPLIDTSSATDVHAMFSFCTSATSFPLIDTSSATDVHYMFNACTSATSFPLIDTSSATDVHAMFSVCTSATSFPLIDTSSAIKMQYMFNACSSATAFPALDTSKATGMWYFYRNCTSLICLPKLDFTSSTNSLDILKNTPNRVTPTNDDIPALGNVWINPNPCP